ncbi:SRPBCC family protein [Nocardia brevicatena]|uniref:SRPBCC family protein n=1 Tax=Nocardia brevicatena TaxID=37327 RepID=UPI00030FBF83|nr:SRPBCC family protein [Nocardia brevicatena]
MWSATATVVTKADRNEVFARYRDVASWSQWDEGVEDVSLDGPFEAGTTGVLSPAGRPKVAFIITVAEPGRRFTDVARLPGARMTFDHTLNGGTDGGTVITHTVTISGPMAFLFSVVIGRAIAKGMPDAVQALARVAESGRAEI